MSKDKEITISAEEFSALHRRIEELKTALREILRVLNEDENDDWRLDTVHRAQRALETKQ